MNRNNTITILCDFDGTITNEDTMDLLLEAFGDKSWKNIGEQYLAGLISHAEMNSQFSQMINISPKEMENFLLKNVHIREGWNEFTNFVSKNNLRLIIVSSGWDYYIRSVLKKSDLITIQSLHQLSNIPSNRLSLLSNNVSYSEQEKIWRLTLTWEKLECQLSSPCKGKIAEEIANTKFIIGNSESDYCMADKADFIYSTGSLSNYCVNKKLKHKPFVTFFEIIDNLKVIIN